VPDAIVRPYLPSDHDAVYDICIVTSEAADGSFHDPQIVPIVYVGPYLELEPALAFVLDNGERAVGYVVGTSDSAAFAARVRAEWLPLYADRYPEPANGTTPEEWIQAALHRPEGPAHEGFGDYRAHLHINLLAGYRGRGYGRELVDRLLGVLRTRGVKGVHLSVGRSNTNAIAFYGALGFEPLAHQPWDTALNMGRSVD
jgi:ribosomal protein S18 acetylase RimI-like enzyme